MNTVTIIYESMPNQYDVISFIDDKGPNGEVNLAYDDNLISWRVSEDTEVGIPLSRVYSIRETVTKE